MISEADNTRIRKLADDLTVRLTQRAGEPQTENAEARFGDDRTAREAADIERLSHL